MTQFCLTDSQDGWDWIFTDINTVPDWQIRDGDLARDNQLLSAVIIQLFTNKRAPDDMDLPLDLPRPQGWWGDAYHEFEIGSLLWTLYRERLDRNTLLKAERYVRDAMRPIIAQGAASRVEPVVTMSGDVLSIDVALYGRDGTRVFKEEFQRFWENV